MNEEQIRVYWEQKHKAEHVGTGKFWIECEPCFEAKERIQAILDSKKPVKAKKKVKYDRTVNKDVWPINNQTKPGRGGEPYDSYED